MFRARLSGTVGEALDSAEFWTEPGFHSHDVQNELFVTLNSVTELGLEDYRSRAFMNRSTELAAEKAFKDSGTVIRFVGSFSSSRSDVVQVATSPGYKDGSM